jgi:hypothetical protein
MRVRLVSQSGGQEILQATILTDGSRYDTHPDVLTYGVRVFVYDSEDVDDHGVIWTYREANAVQPVRAEDIIQLGAV